MRGLDISRRVAPYVADSNEFAAQHKPTSRPFPEGYFNLCPHTLAERTFGARYIIAARYISTTRRVMQASEETWLGPL